MGAERAALLRVQRLFDEGSEDGGFDVAPVVFRRRQQFADLLPRHREGLRVVEQAAVEPAQMSLEQGVEAVVVVRRVHLAPQLLKQRGEAVGAVEAVGQEGGELALGQEVHVLGEHGEDAAHQEMRHLFRRVVALQPARDGGEAFGDLARDAGGLTRRVQRLGLGPDRLQPGDDVGVSQVLQPDAETLAVGEVGAGAAGP